MRYGVCRGITEYEDIKTIKEAGFDYVECGFCGLSRESDEVFESFKAALKKNNIKCEAANGFIPKDLPLIGDGYDKEKTAAYIENGMKRGAEIGLKVVVFGSGRAREVPENVSYAEGFRQLGVFLNDVVSPLAEKYGITVAIEPLRMQECNIINTVKEGTMLAVLSGKDNIACLADIYHMLFANDTYDDIRQLKGSLKHAHISNPTPADGSRRTYPASLDEYDYQGYIDALNYAGCERCSVEAGCEDFATDAVLAGKLLKSLK